MSSEPEATADEQLARLTVILWEYEKGCGLAELRTNPEAERLQNLTLEELRAMSPEECAEGAFILCQLALNVQRRENWEKSVVEWADELIDQAYAKYGDSFRIDGFQTAKERRSLVIQANVYVKKLNQIRQQAQNRVNRLIFLSGKIEGLAKKLENYSFTKRGR